MVYKIDYNILSCISFSQSGSSGVGSPTRESIALVKTVNPGG